MGRLQQMRAQTVGIRKEDTFDLPSANHFKQSSMTEGIRKEASRMGLRRVSGNIFIRPATQDFWNVRGGKIVRLIGVEVDNGESMAGAPVGNPGDFLQDVLDDLTF